MIRITKTASNPNIWTRADKEKLRDLFFEGYNDEEIAKKMGRTPKAVCIQRSLLKLPKKRQPPRRFGIHDAMADYYPKWYKDYLIKQWEKEQSMSTMS